MPQSDLRLIKHCREFLPFKEITLVPPRTRGIYVLYRRRRRKGEEKFDVVYVGMARAGRQSGIRGRLTAHRRRKADLWTHFSYFEAWDNISAEEIAELEGLFRHLYRDDQRANRLNKQRGFKPLNRLRRKCERQAKAMTKGAS